MSMRQKHLLLDSTTNRKAFFSKDFAKAIYSFDTSMELVFTFYVLDLPLILGDNWLLLKKLYL